jgi:CheY-like chemotaxis protein
MPLSRSQASVRLSAGRLNCCASVAPSTRIPADSLPHEHDGSVRCHACRHVVVRRDGRRTAETGAARLTARRRRGVQGGTAAQATDARPEKLASFWRGLCYFKCVFRQLKPRVLCIDDELMVGQFVQDALERTGEFIVKTETDPFAALDTARAFRPDVLFIDINMPGRDGLAVARQIRQEPWLRHRPIIFFSGMSEKAEAALKAAGDGPTEFLQKGVPLSVIVETVQRVASERLQLYKAFRTAVVH